ncbi:MAG: pilus (MSHA type) biogenesis protein MshL [Burkholderiaceae bacterium]|nr:pilus (MSHA type) biogenesis protein MshL [Burkholderiaceae bacterium]
MNITVPKHSLIAVAVLALAGCAASPPLQPPKPSAAMAEALTVPEPAAAPPAALPVGAAPEIPPAPTPAAAPDPNEPRISIAMNNVPARQFFMALTAGTPYMMLVHTNVGGNLSAKLQNVTVPEALDAMRELYDFDIVLQGRKITVRQPVMETRVFQVNYPTGTRKGSSDTRVSAGSLTDLPPTTGVPGAPPPTTGRGPDSSRVSTASEVDFWQELKTSLAAVTGIAEGSGKSIVVSPQSGVVVVRAMPKELRDVVAYLKATQLSVERQVILEAKIIEVQLSDSYQAGVNWSAFRAGGTQAAGGVLQPGASLNNTPGTPLTGGSLSAVAGNAISTVANSGGTMFGLALQGTSFAALVSFLETQGAVQVLSSPRVSTLNNQQAVLKVGTDEFFVTGVSGGTTTPSAGGAITTTPNVTLRPFFSGVVLDVLPQIDAEGNVILHIRPSVSQVTTVNRNINLGVGGQLQLPLASSSASEADSVVRARNGQVVVIGGLMRESAVNDRSQVPGIGNASGIGKLFGSTTRTAQKRELVILLKPTVVTDGSEWNDDLLKAGQRVQQLGTRKTK